MPLSCAEIFRAICHLFWGPGIITFRKWSRPKTLLALGPGFFRARYKPRSTLHFALSLDSFRIRQFPEPQVFFFGLQPLHITSSLGPGYSRVRVWPRHILFMVCLGLFLLQDCLKPTCQLFEGPGILRVRKCTRPTCLLWAQTLSGEVMSPGPHLFFLWPRIFQVYIVDQAHN